MASTALAGVEWQDLSPGVLQWRALLRDTRRNELLAIAGSSDPGVELLHATAGTGAPWSSELVLGDAPEGPIEFAVYDSLRDRIIVVPYRYSGPAGFRRLHVLSLSGPRMWVAIDASSAPADAYGARYTYDEASAKLLMQGGWYYPPGGWIASRSTLYECIVQSPLMWSSGSEPPVPYGLRIADARLDEEGVWHFFGGRQCVQHGGCNYDDTYARYFFETRAWHAVSAAGQGPDVRSITLFARDPVTRRSWLAEWIGRDPVSGLERVQLWSVEPGVTLNWQKEGGVVSFEYPADESTGPSFYDQDARAWFAGRARRGEAMRVVRRDFTDLGGTQVTPLPAVAPAFDGNLAWFDGRTGSVCALAGDASARVLHLLDRSVVPAVWRSEPVAPGGSGNITLAVGYDPYSRRALILDRSLRLWGFSTRSTPAWSEVAVLGGPPDGVIAAAFDPARRRFLVVARPAGDFGRWTDAAVLDLSPVPAWRSLAVSGVAPFVTNGTSVALSPDGTHLGVLGGSGRLNRYDTDRFSQDFVVAEVSRDSLAWGDAISTLAPRISSQLFYDTERDRWVFEGGTGSSSIVSLGWQACPPRSPLLITGRAYGGWAPEPRRLAGVVRVPATKGVVLFSGRTSEEWAAPFAKTTWARDPEPAPTVTAAVRGPAHAEAGERPPLTITATGPASAPVRLAWSCAGATERDTLLSFDVAGRCSVEVSVDIPETSSGTLPITAEAAWLEDESIRAVAAGSIEALRLSLEGAAIAAGPDWLELEWFVSDSAIIRAEVLRRDASAGWVAQTVLESVDPGRFVWRDSSLVPETEYEYALRVVWRARTRDLGNVAARTAAAPPPPAPVQQDLGFARSLRNPLASPWLVAVMLPGTGAPTLEVIDVSGRARTRIPLAGLGAGPKEVLLPGDVGLRPGLYLIRLRDGSRSISRRIVLLR